MARLVIGHGRRFLVTAWSTRLSEEVVFADFVCIPR